MTAAAPPPPADPWDDRAIAHLSCTSRTTGRPKGACVAHEPTMCVTSRIAERLLIADADVPFAATAPSRSHHLVADIMAPLHRGAGAEVMRSWTPEGGVDALEATGATVPVANPTILHDLLDASRATGPRCGT